MKAGIAVVNPNLTRACAAGPVAAMAARITRYSAASSPHSGLA